MQTFANQSMAMSDNRQAVIDVFIRVYFLPLVYQSTNSHFFSLTFFPYFDRKMTFVITLVIAEYRCLYQ